MLFGELSDDNRDDLLREWCQGEDEWRDWCEEDEDELEPPPGYPESDNFYPFWD